MLDACARQSRSESATGWVLPQTKRSSAAAASLIVQLDHMMHVSAVDNALVICIDLVHLIVTMV